MSTNVVTVAPDAPVSAIARLLLEHGVSAVPVVDAAGAPVGMVSEGDLIGRNDTAREARRDWWLEMLAEGEALSPEFLAHLRDRERTAREVMAAPVVTVEETTEAAEIARLLTDYRVKRVPVVRDGRIVGIVSRADLVRALAAELRPAAPVRHEVGGLLAEAIAALDHRLTHRQPRPASGAAEAQPAPAGPSADEFRELVADAEQHQAERRDEARRVAATERQERVKALSDEHVAEADWQALLRRARQAAEQDQTEFMLLRFPSDLCSDGGRAINAPLPDWPRTLRGEAAEIYLRWERDLKRRGFGLTARVLDFPGGFPGDIGLFLGWGK